MNKASTNDTSSAALASEHDKTDWLSVGILWCVGIAAAMQFAKFSIAFTDLQTQYGVNATQMGFALSIVGVVGLIFGVSAGVLAGRIGYRRVLIVALMVGAALSLFQSFLLPLPVLLISRLAEGISHLGIVVAAPTMMAFVSARRHQSITMAIWGTFFGLAFALLGWIGPIIIEHSGLSALFLAHAALMMVLALFAFRVPVANPQVKNPKRATFRNFLDDNLMVYTNPRTVLPGVVFLFHTCMFIALLTFVPRLTPHSEVTGLLLVALPLVSIVGTFLAGLIAQYLMKPQTLVIFAYIVVAVLSIAASAVISNSDIFVYASMALLLASGLIQGATFATIPHLTRGADEQAQANGAVAQLGNLGATIGPPLFAMAIGNYGTTGMIWLTSLLCIAGVLIGGVARKIEVARFV